MELPWMLYHIMGAGDIYHSQFLHFTLNNVTEVYIQNFYSVYHLSTDD